MLKNRVGLVVVASVLRSGSCGGDILSSGKNIDIKDWLRWEIRDGTTTHVLDCSD